MDGLSTIQKSHSVEGRYDFGHIFDAYKLKVNNSHNDTDSNQQSEYSWYEQGSRHTWPHIFQIWPVVFIWALCIQHTGKHAELPEPSSISVNDCFFFGKYYWPQLKGAFLLFWSPLQTQRTEQHVARKSCIQWEAMKTSACRVSKKGW